VACPTASSAPGLGRTGALSPDEEAEAAAAALALAVRHDSSLVRSSELPGQQRGGGPAAPHSSPRASGEREPALRHDRAPAKTSPLSAADAGQSSSASGRGAACGADTGGCLAGGGSDGGSGQPEPPEADSASSSSAAVSAVRVLSVSGNDAPTTSAPAPSPRRIVRGPNGVIRREGPARLPTPPAAKLDPPSATSVPPRDPGSAQASPANDPLGKLLPGMPAASAARLLLSQEPTHTPDVPLTPGRATSDFFDRLYGVSGLGASRADEVGLPVASLASSLDQRVWPPHNRSLPVRLTRGATVARSADVVDAGASAGATSALLPMAASPAELESARQSRDGSATAPARCSDCEDDATEGAEGRAGDSPVTPLAAAAAAAQSGSESAADSRPAPAPAPAQALPSQPGSSRRPSPGPVKTSENAGVPTTAQRETTDAAASRHVPVNLQPVTAGAPCDSQPLLSARSCGDTPTKMPSGAAPSDSSGAASSTSGTVPQSGPSDAASQPAQARAPAVDGPATRTTPPRDAASRPTSASRCPGVVHRRSPGARPPALPPATSPASNGAATAGPGGAGDGADDHDVLRSQPALLFAARFHAGAGAPPPAASREAEPRSEEQPRPRPNPSVGRIDVSGLSALSAPAKPRDRGEGRAQLAADCRAELQESALSSEGGSAGVAEPQPLPVPPPVPVPPPCAPAAPLHRAAAERPCLSVQGSAGAPVQGAVPEPSSGASSLQTTATKSVGPAGGATVSDTARPDVASLAQQEVSASPSCSHRWWSDVPSTQRRSVALSLSAAAHATATPEDLCLAIGERIGRAVTAIGTTDTQLPLGSSHVGTAVSGSVVAAGLPGSKPPTLAELGVPLQQRFVVVVSADDVEPAPAGDRGELAGIDPCAPSAQIDSAPSARGAKPQPQPQPVAEAPVDSPAASPAAASTSAPMADQSEESSSPQSQQGALPAMQPGGQAAPASGPASSSPSPVPSSPPGGAALGRRLAESIGAAVDVTGAGSDRGDALG